MKRHPEQGFPRALLNSSPIERVQYFVKHRIAHTRLQGATDEIFNRLKSMTVPDIILATGPTGVGKTTMATSLSRSVLALYQSRLIDDRNSIPVVSVTAVPPLEGSFDWKDFAIRVLWEMNEPLIDRKVLCPGASDTQSLGKGPVRNALVSALKNRKVKVMIIDEAHHVLMVAEKRRLKYQFEALKSLAEETGICIVLIGTYDLLQIRDQSGQLVRRSHIVHLPRYDARNYADKEEFISALYTFQKHLPFEVEPDFISDWRYYYLKSIGCIGILKTWLDRCLEQALEDKQKTIDRDFADLHAHDNKELQTILAEALVGEAEMRDCTLRELEQAVFAPLTLDDPVDKPKQHRKSTGRVGIPKARRRTNGSTA